MMRSLFSGVSGLRTHQTKMDVIGNNIANVNTVGYKSSSVTFSELMYQTTQSASGPNAATNRGGINAKQIGLGVQLGAINSNIASQGAAQSTGNTWDFMISGDSFFVVNDGTSNYFTRAGAFTLDAAGDLVMTTTGYKVMGWKPDAENPNAIKKDTVSALQIMNETNMTSDAEQTVNGYISGIIDPKDSNVSLTTGAVMTMQIYDSLGESYTVKYAMYNYDPGAAGAANTPLGDGVYRMAVTDILDSKGKSIVSTDNGGTGNVQDYVTLTGTAAATPTTQYVKYDTVSGAFLGIADTGANAAAIANGTTNGRKDFNLNFVHTGGTPARPTSPDSFALPINVDMSVSQRTSHKGTSTIGGQPGTSNGEGIGAGKPAGELKQLAVDQYGKIMATYSNGDRKLLGQIAVTSFANPSGLEKVGENLYADTMNSGGFDGVGKDVSEDGGKISSGVLEMSDVDLSAQFTEMITTQRGFQANSRIITVSDTLLEELTNLKR